MTSTRSPLKTKPRGRWLVVSCSARAASERLDGSSLEDVAHEYFLRSEQIPTRVRLAVAEELRAEAGGTRHRWVGPARCSQARRLDTRPAGIVPAIGSWNKPCEVRALPAPQTVRTDHVWRWRQWHRHVPVGWKTPIADAIQRGRPEVNRS